MLTHLSHFWHDFLLVSSHFWHEFVCFAAKYVSLFLCNLSSITPYPQCLQIITYQRQNHSFFAYLDNSSLSLQIILLNLHVSTLCWFIIDVTE